MENASKALLIAGAILIALLFISVGIGVITSGSDTADQVDSNMESTSATNFNAQFLPYLSNSTSASKAKSLIKKVMAHNAKVSTGSNFSPEKHQIYINLYKKDNQHLKHKWKSSELQKQYNNIYNTSKYSISVTSLCSYAGGYYNGYVICLSITEL